MKKILMIGTGGTIASRQTEGGLAPGLTTEELLSFIPQAAEICRIETMQLCSIDSTNMTPGIWLEIAGAVEAHYTEYDGFVICHGTDTLAYTCLLYTSCAWKCLTAAGTRFPCGFWIFSARSGKASEA